MIAVWIVAGAFMLTGFIIGGPIVIKLITCKETVQGTILPPSDKYSKDSDYLPPCRYEYSVDGITYVKSLIAAMGKFTYGAECTVVYNPKCPKQSYMKKSGRLAVLIAFGVPFFLAGVLVLICGIFFAL